jgi:hypothetical protein
MVLDRAAIAKLKQFVLPKFEDQVELDENKHSSIQIESRTLAISCWSNMPSNLLFLKI